MENGNAYNIKDPQILNSVFDEKILKELQDYSKYMKSNFPNYDQSFGRHQWANTKELYSFHEKLVEIARQHFESDTILPTWNLLSTYEGNNAKLWKHKDDNACTFHLDVCVYQNEPWDLWVEGKPYTLLENQALAMYGNDQEHWREQFPNPETNIVANAFFFFAEPDHWYFTKGADYLRVIRKEITEEEFYSSRVCL